MNHQTTYHFDGRNTNVECGGCHAHVRVVDTKPGRLPDGTSSYCFYDKRPKTPTGGRLGVQKLGRFKREHTVRHEFLCAHCHPDTAAIMGPRPETRSPLPVDPRAPRLVRNPGGAQ